MISTQVDDRSDDNDTIGDDENDDCDINNKSLFRNDDDYEPKFTKSK